MGLYFLYILLIILVPLAYGAALALVLREIRARQLGEAGETIPETIGETPQEEEPPEDELNSLFDDDEKENTEPAKTKDAESTELPATEPKPETPTEAAVVEEPPAAPRETENEVTEKTTENAAAKEEETEIKKEKSVFDDKGLLPKTFKVDNVIDEMLDENNTEAPEDLSSRIEEDYGNLENRLDEFEEKDDDFFDLDDDPLARAMEFAGDDSWGESGNAPDFSDEADTSTPASSETPPSISSTAREILGDDFDFDSLMSDVAEPFEETEDTTEPMPEIPVLRELGDGIYQAETVSMESGDSPAGDFIDEQEILSAFPGEMVSDTVVEPERSEAALKNSFVEESRPMFVRKRKDS